VNLVPFNINGEVRVKLTDHGRWLHRKNHDDLMADWAARGIPTRLDYTPPREDADGWSKWQMWVLMKEFGPHIFMGMDNPFDLEVVFEVPEERHVESGLLVDATRRLKL